MIASDGSLTPRQVFALDQLAAALVEQVEQHLASKAGYQAYLDQYFATEFDPGEIDRAVAAILASA